MPTIHWVSGSLVPDAELTCPPDKDCMRGMPVGIFRGTLAFYFILSIYYPYAGYLAYDGGAVHPSGTRLAWVRGMVFFSLYSWLVVG